MVKNLSVNISSFNYSLDKKFIHNIVRELKKELEFTISDIRINFINSKKIMELNKTYLNHNFSTDVITFNYSESQKNLDGEIYISLDDAESNSKKYRVKFKDEILRLVIHGFLHLLGYNDQSQKEKTVMKKLENKLLNKYKVLIN